MVDLTTGLGKPRSDIELLTQGVTGPDQPLALAGTDQPSNFRAAPTFPPLDPSMKASLDLIHSKESAQGNRPNYRYDDKHTAGGDLQITDTNWRHYAPQLGIDVSQYPNAMSAPPDVQYQVGAKMKAEMGYGPWFPYNAALRQALTGKAISSPGFASAAVARQGAEDIQRESYSSADRLSSEARSLIKGVGDAGGDIETSMRRIREAQDKSDEANQAVVKATKTQPHEPIIDGIKQFGSVASIVGLLGGLFTRRPLQASLNASAAAIEAANKGDLRDYKIHYDAWKDNTELLQNIARANRDRVHDIVSSEKLGLDEKQRLLDVTLRGIGLERLADQMRLSGLGAVQDWNEKMFEADSRLEIAKERMSSVGSMFGKGVGNITAKAFSDQVKADTGHEPTYDDWLRFSQETKGSATGRLSDEAAHNVAMQAVAGDDKAIPALARSGPARTQVENEMAKILEDEPLGAQLVTMNRVRMVEATSAARTAGRVTMNTELYAQEAKLAAQQVIEASKKFPRTNFPRVNEALAAWERGTGDPNIIDFGGALNQLINAYGKLSNPTGQGIHDADKNRIVAIMDTSLSQGQIEAGANRVVTDGITVSTAARNAQLQVLQHMIPLMPGQTQAPSFGPPVEMPKYTPSNPAPTPTPPTATPGAAALPEGVPPGSVHAGTSKGKPVWRAPDGGLYGEQ